MLCPLKWMPRGKGDVNIKLFLKKKRDTFLKKQKKYFFVTTMKNKFYFLKKQQKIYKRRFGAHLYYSSLHT